MKHSLFLLLALFMSAQAHIDLLRSNLAVKFLGGGKVFGGMTVTTDEVKDAAQFAEKHKEDLVKWIKETQESHIGPDSCQANGKTCDLTPSECKLFDFVIDCEDVSALLSTGRWNINVHNWTSTLASLEVGMRGTYTAIVGLYNKGKTWFLNMLSGYELPSGLTTNTKGISVKFSTDMILLDTAGRQAPVKFGSQDRIAAETLTYMVMSDVADYYIVVVNDITYAEELMVLDILKQRTHTDIDLVLVHNYKDRNVSQIQHSFESYVEPYFPNGTKKIIGSDGLFFYSSKTKYGNIRHYFLANHAYFENWEWNKGAFTDLRAWFLARIAEVDKSSKKYPIYRISESLNRHLPRFLVKEAKDPLQVIIDKDNQEIVIATEAKKHALKDLPIPDVYPIPQTSAFVPAQSSHYTDDGSLLLQVEVPGINALKVRCNQTNSEIDCFDDENQTVCQLSITGVDVVLNGTKPLSPFDQNRLFGLAYGSWKVGATLANNRNFYEQNVRLVICNGVIYVHVPSDKSKFVLEECSANKEIENLKEKVEDARKERELEAERGEKEKKKKEEEIDVLKRDLSDAKTAFEEAKRDILAFKDEMERKERKLEDVKGDLRDSMRETVAWKEEAEKKVAELCDARREIQERKMEAIKKEGELEDSKRENATLRNEIEAQMHSHVEAKRELERRIQEFENEVEIEKKKSESLSNTIGILRKEIEEMKKKWFCK